MYTSAQFSATGADVDELLRNANAADLTTNTVDGLQATYLPVIYDPDVGPHGSLLAHLARNNEQWKVPPIGEAMAIVRGPDAYITPSWYASKREHGRVVPTWNYVTAHVYGELRVHDDPAWVAAMVRRLTERHEQGREHPWSVDDAPEKYLTGQLRAIVGVQLVISRVEAKFKLSQNRPAADIDGVVAGLRTAGEDAMSAAVDTFRPDRLDERSARKPA
ncbi:FMN-binding negative transcriptional regulator [Actinoplanes sp. NPDC026619]|uniref:FMN-binding negative transcriptional regulator n=1 Tax=Actinoplanes sp. NPDC026619 TaxID=3155798 RepID=UPI0033C440F0